ncbi:DUF1848 domain-containing protein [Pelodictyon luteolum]|uniref:DUF1848 domain-containing protein n=1 Tax=Chlorobium luteolum (strain DSM 273 / BCRC 81028 / 2530) TaxID=319225 RepID=Q3B3M0_CHLL3|nr:DUF1848 domain-containing protein [Pelodictyon luteolum]ABB24061.1 conserved hypothetical protein [Pelodictyon luteolum DSM 273]
MIISASRRTDIPACHGEWFMECLRAGEVLVPNPMRPSQVSRIALNPDALEGIVFWTKDPGPFMPFLPELDRMGYPYYFLFTLTPYGTDIEPCLPPKPLLVDRFRCLSEHLGPERVIWRYDPVILTARMDVQWHLESFAHFARELSGYTRHAIISFVDRYRKTQRAMQALGTLELDAAAMEAVAGGCARIAAECGMELSACAEALDLSQAGVRPASCVDRDLLLRISGRAQLDLGLGRNREGGRKKDPGQRHQCGCAPSRDIGTYGTCSHRCLYCYAS